MADFDVTLSAGNDIDVTLDDTSAPIEVELGSAASGGTIVTANPGGTGNTALTSIAIGTTSYDIAAGTTSTVTLDELTSFLADSSGTAVASTDEVFASANDTFWVVRELTDTAPRMGITLPAGKNMRGIFDQGVRIDQDDFDQSGQTYTHNFDVGAGWVLYLVLTETP